MTACSSFGQLRKGEAVLIQAGAVASRVRELTDGRGVDLVVDPVGGRTLEASIASLANRGRVSWVGRVGRDSTPPEVWPLMEKNASLTGVFLGAEMVRNPGRVRAMIERLLRRVADGELRVVIDRVFPLADAASLHREPTGLRSGAAAPLTVHLAVSDGRVLHADSAAAGAQTLRCSGRMRC